jgi:hypothetical protein
MAPRPRLAGPGRDLNRNAGKGATVPMIFIYTLCLENPKIGGVDDAELSVTESQKMAQFFGTSSRRKCRTDRLKSSLAILTGQRPARKGKTVAAAGFGPDKGSSRYQTRGAGAGAGAGGIGSRVAHEDIVGRHAPPSQPGCQSGGDLSACSLRRRFERWSQEAKRNRTRLKFSRESGAAKGTYSASTVWKAMHVTKKIKAS